MDSEMQFGELEEAVPRTALRPDRNRHFAVRAFGQPSDADLPVFIDLDALRQMEYHAVSDLSVELGGVMIGGQYLDQDGKPFVLVSDVLQAEHYESTKGSFKFTHDTWSEITRQMSDFPDEMQIVGWYHTHPDWGVFLSGMDMFICENFFNKPLDVAFVIDPCRGDRGMFFWRTSETGRHAIAEKQRAAGFYVVASRFRGNELDEYVQQLEEQSEMSTRTRSVGPVMGSSSPVVHIVERNSSGLMTAITGMLVMQFCLLALLAWRMGTFSTSEPAAAAQDTQQLAELLKEWREDEQRVLEANAKLEVVNQLLEQNGQGENVATEIAQRNQQIEQLQASLLGLEHARQVTESKLADVQRAQNEIQKREKKLTVKLQDKSESLEEARTEVSELKEELAILRGDATDKEDGGRFAFLGNTWTIVAIAVGGVMILGIGAVVASTIIARRQNQVPMEAEEVTRRDRQP